MLIIAVAGAALPPGTADAETASDRACGQEPGNRFHWIERAFCDLDANAPLTAQGVVIYNHGLQSTMPAWRAPVPPVFRLLQTHGWEVFALKRNHLAEARGSTWSLDRTVERTLDEAKHQRAAGYRKIVFAGQSFGGLITLTAAEEAKDLFAAIAMAPGVRTTSGDRAGGLDVAVIERSLQRIKVERVAVVFPANDALFGNLVRGPGANRILSVRRLPYLLLDEETPDIVGHGGGTSAKFASLYGPCLLDFLSAATIPAGRFTCPAGNAPVK